MDANLSCSEAISLIKSTNCDQFPVKAADGTLAGMLTTAGLMGKLSKQKVTLDDPVSKCMSPMKTVKRLSSAMPVHELARCLERETFVLVDDALIATSFDVLDYMQAHMKPKA